MKLNEVGSQREDDFNKHRLVLPQKGVAGYRLLCLLAVETRICSAEEFVMYKELCLWPFLLQRKANARQQSLSDKVENLI